ncbi:MAG TPA: arsenosugar biosynthesis radical SAM (seleno)protein ArsS [Candidatus Krumholzibacteria bacterium]|nr:arsenosugar biosynthesis radical SAM (seleno)protein ArsS [Candidatus Krumholzibacteria bacterium]
MLLKDGPDPAVANEFDARVQEATGGPLHAERITVIQVNIGLTCNLSCAHCHVSSSPRRREQMNWDTMTHVLRVADEIDAALIDVTGGAPEMNPEFRRFVRVARERGRPVQVRTNLTIMLEPGYEDMPAFFAGNAVRLVASLPCYTEENVDRQRGSGVYGGSIEVIRRLNALGYGHEPHLPLDLMFNPAGAGLPGDQAQLEADYRRELDGRFGIVFSRLLTIANMPIGRFMVQLRRENKAEAYRRMLRDSFNQATIAPLMCRHQIEVDWNGTLYDCDFNLALRKSIGNGKPANIRDFDASLHRRRIVTGSHCFGCTAGMGSSCGGALV